MVILSSGMSAPPSVLFVDVALYESTNFIHCPARLGKERRAGGVAVKHFLSDTQCDVYPRILCLPRKSCRVVAKHFIATGMDEKRRQPVKIPIQRRYPRRAGLIVSGVIFAENGRRPRPAQRICLGIRFQG